MNKWTNWWDSLPEHTQAYQSKQPIWHDRDLACVISMALVFGFIIGYFTGYF